MTKSKSKKVYFIAIPIILLIVVGLAIYFQYTAAKTPLKLCSPKFMGSVKEEDIARMEIASIKKTETTDKEKIGKFVDMLNSTTFKYVGKDEKMGCNAIVMFYSVKNEFLGSIGFMTNEYIRCMGKGYEIVSGTINIEEIKKFLE